MSYEPFWRFRPTDEEYLLERQRINAAKAAYGMAKYECGPLSPEAIDALFELSKEYCQHGHYKMAEWILERIWFFAPYIYPEDDIRSSDILVRCAFRSKEKEEALQLGTQAVECAQRISGVDSIDAGYAMYNLGTLCSNHSQLEEALEWQLAGIECLRKHLPDNAPELLSMIRRTARWCTMFKAYDTAIQLKEELYQINSRDHGPDSIEAFRAMTSMARTHDLLGQHEQAILLWRKCCEAMQEMQSLGASDLFPTLHDYCECCLAAGAFEEALPIALYLLETEPPSRHKKHMMLYVIGFIHKQCGDYKSAVHYLKAAVEEIDSHKEVIYLREKDIKGELASVYRLLGWEQEAADVEASLFEHEAILDDLPAFPYETLDDGNGGQRIRVTAIEPEYLRDRHQC